MPPNGQLREIPQKVQKLAAHRSLASGDVGRIGPALTIAGSLARTFCKCLHGIVEEGGVFKGCVNDADLAKK